LAFSFNRIEQIRSVAILTAGQGVKSLTPKILADPKDCSGNIKRRGCKSMARQDSIARLRHGGSIARGNTPNNIIVEVLKTY
jgi:hypothetical protein